MPENQELGTLSTDFDSLGRVSDFQLFLAGGFGIANAMLIKSHQKADLYGTGRQKSRLQQVQFEPATREAQ